MDRRLSLSSEHLRLLDPEGTEGVLLGTRCGQCGVTVFGPTALCPHCTSDELTQVELSRHGQVWSYTFVHTPTKEWKGEVPYALVDVELPEGPRVLAALVDCRFGDVRIGMPVALALRVAEVDGDGNQIVAYRWRPVGSPASLGAGQ
jgi:uncharacterized OB-fold protein